MTQGRLFLLPTEVTSSAAALWVGWNRSGGAARGSCYNDVCFRAGLWLRQPFGWLVHR